MRPRATIAMKPKSTTIRRPYFTRVAISRREGGVSPWGWVSEIAIAPLKKTSPSRPVIVIALTASAAAAILIPLVRSRASTSTLAVIASSRPSGTKTTNARTRSAGAQLR